MSTNIFTQGISQDSLPKYQPEGTYRFALNAVLESKEGDIPSISNELGNINCAVGFPTNKVIIGHTLTESNDIVLFLWAPDARTDGHEIGIYTPKNCTYTTIAKDACLNFSQDYQMNAFSKVRNGCNTYVYFTDNYNPYRVVNITDTTEWLNEDKTLKSCDIIMYSRPYRVPQTNLNILETDSGGNLDYGVYYFSMRYLDKDENPTDWLYVTNPVAIGNNSYSLLTYTPSHSQYTGQSNTTTDYQKENSNKSINLDLSNVDTTFKYLQLAVIKRTADSGAITGVDILNPIEILANTLSYKYTGFISQVVGESSLDDIFSSKVKIDKVKTHTHKDGRLFLANTSTKLRNYIGYQRHASKIKTSWKRKGILGYKDQTTTPTDLEVGTSKTQEFYFDKGSFLEDEVYALGIVYVHRDGTESPVFHIPGRPADVFTSGKNPRREGAGAWDTETISSGELVDPTKDKAWQVYNTAGVTSSSGFLDEIQEGYMSYYETSTNYPVMNVPCDTEDFWGVDSEGNTLVSTPIRHHRFPSSEVIDPGAYTNTVWANFRLGLKFEITEGYPSEDIVDHFFVFSDRTEESTIKDMGVLLPAYETPEDELGNFNMFNLNASDPFFNIGIDGEYVDHNRSTYYFVSSNTLLKSRANNGTYLKIHKALPLTYLEGSSGTGVAVEGTDTIDVSAQTCNYLTYDLFPKETKLIYNLDFISKVDPTPIGSLHTNSVYTPTNYKQVKNYSVSNTYGVVTTTIMLPQFDYNASPGSPLGYLYFVSIRSYDEVFTNLPSIKYIRIGNKTFLETEDPIGTYEYFDGDTFVSRLDITDHAYQVSGTPLVNVWHASFFTQDWNINPEFRSQGNTKQTARYLNGFRKYTSLPGVQFTDNLQKYIASKYYKIGDIPYFYPETYQYNDSYSYNTPLGDYRSYSYTYEYCNDCLENHPTRIYYSQADTLESKYDPYRIIRPNNYQQQISGTGPIQDLFCNFDKLYALTTNSVYMLHNKPQQILTDISSLYLGTGEVLSLPPTELKNTDYAFAGTEVWKSRVITEYGTFYVDNLSSRPFLLTNQLIDLSLNGLRTFWQEHGRLELSEQFKTMTGKPFPVLSTSSSAGIGYISTYDPRYKRLIVHKKDYKLRVPYDGLLVYQDRQPLVNNVLWFDGMIFRWVNNDASTTIVDFSSTDYFENKSFTISYSFITNKWVSFHSYLPYYMFNNYETFFSNGVYKHNAGDYQTYYNTKYDHIVDLIAKVNPSIKETTNAIYYTSNVSKPNYNQDFAIQDATYTGLIAYNDLQSTFYSDLKLNTPFTTNINDIEVKKTDNIWRLNNIRDKVNNPSTPIWSTYWLDIQSYPFNYIDKIPNPSNKVVNPSLYSSPRLKDFYTGIRFFFKPEENLKITTDVVEIMNFNNIR